MDDKKVLLTGGNLLQAHTWKGLLETHSITVELKGEALLGGVGELPVDMQNVELWVNKSDFITAQSVLEAHEIELPQWKCLLCHEVNHGSFELCWQCSAQKSELQG